MVQELVDSFRFRYDGMAGYISGGHQHGVEITEGADGKPVTRAMGLNLEHYYARSSSGHMVPRIKADIRTERRGDEIRIIISPYANWSVDAIITYRLLPERTIEACYEFSFHADYAAFEGFISNYFHDPIEPYVHIGGRWVLHKLGEREHRWWPRSESDAINIRDGRLVDLLKSSENFIAPLDPLFYDYPLMVTQISNSGWSIIHSMEKHTCSSLSANRTWNAHDFSIVGRDVSKGETIRCHAWMTYAKLESINDALLIYKRFSGDKV